MPRRSAATPGPSCRRGRAFSPARASWASANAGAGLPIERRGHFARIAPEADQQEADDDDEDGERNQQLLVHEGSCYGRPPRRRPCWLRVRRQSIAAVGAARKPPKAIRMNPPHTQVMNGLRVDANNQQAATLYPVTERRRRGRQKRSRCRWPFIAWVWGGTGLDRFRWLSRCSDGALPSGRRTRRSTGGGCRRPIARAIMNKKLLIPLAIFVAIARLPAGRLVARSQLAPSPLVGKTSGRLGAPRAPRRSQRQPESRRHEGPGLAAERVGVVVRVVP